jgi:hypothetical protein
MWLSCNLTLVSPDIDALSTHYMEFLTSGLFNLTSGVSANANYLHRSFIKMTNLRDVEKNLYYKTGRLKIPNWLTF